MAFWRSHIYRGRVDRYNIPQSLGSLLLRNTEVMPPRVAVSPPPQAGDFRMGCGVEKQGWERDLPSTGSL